jgi:hypothetical protein
LQNKSGIDQDTLRIQRNPRVKTEWQNLPAHDVLLEDAVAGFSILKLTAPLHAGASLVLDFVTTVENPGFTNSGAAGSIQYNGTYFNNFDYFPQFGYVSMKELVDRNERRKRGLGEPSRMPKLEDEAARAYNMVGTEADGINFEATLSTSQDQIAMAPGYLQKSWQENGRNFFQYKMDKPMLPFFAFLSARWEVQQENYKGVSIEIYHDKKHEYNIARMIESTKKSLDYYAANFTPYQYKQVRILEFPRYTN